MKISERISALTPSPIRKLAPYAQAAEAKGKKIYHLNIGQPDIETPKEFMDAICKYNEKVIAYGNSQGEPELIGAVQKYYKEWGMDYAYDEIFVTNGGSEALLFAMMCLCDNEDEILVFEPYYANYNSFAVTCGAVIKGIPTKAEAGYELPDREEIEKHITSKTKAILVTTPGNPTGKTLSKEQIEMLGDIALKYNIAIISDEVYREFAYDEEYVSFGSYPEFAQNVIIIDSISKRYSACGAREGFLITKNKLFGEQVMKCCQTRLCCPVLEQVGAAALYSTPKSYLDAVNKEYKHRRDVITEELGKIPGVIFTKPKGAFYMMVKFPVDDTEKFAVWLLEHFDINGETTMIAPGNGFYVNPEDGKQEARLAYVLNCENLKKAMHIIGEGLKSYPGTIR